MSTVKSYFHIFFAGIARIGLRNHDQPWNYGHRLSYFTARFGRIYGYFLTLIRVDQEILVKSRGRAIPTLCQLIEHVRC